MQTGAEPAMSLAFYARHVLDALASRAGHAKKTGLSIGGVQAAGRIEPKTGLVLVLAVTTWLLVSEVLQIVQCGHRVISRSVCVPFIMH